VRHASFTKAANELHLTQSAISRQIQQLEEFLGRSLFVREHRSLRLTIAGERYAVDVQRLLANCAESTLEVMKRYGDLELTVSRAVDLVPLHGSLDAAAQDLALRPSSRRRIVVATNIAETSVTVPGVTAVVDSGMHKIARYDAERGIDSLDAERITADAAAQRAGRAGRTAPGIVWRLWDARDRLRPHREPEIHRVDLSATVLDVIAWAAIRVTWNGSSAPERTRSERRFGCWNVSAPSGMPG